MGTSEQRLEGRRPVLTGDSEFRRVMASIGFGVLAAVLTIAYMALVTIGRESGGLVLAVAPFIVVASLAGVALPAFLALELAGRHHWLPAATASCLALFIAFIVFWSAGLVATTGPSPVRVGGQTVAATIHFDRAVWLSNMDARARMVDDLVVTKRLYGLTPDEVRAQLGEPASVLGPGIREMWYRITTRAGASPSVLALLFSSEGKVASMAFRQ